MQRTLSPHAPAAPLQMGPAEWGLLCLHSMLWGSSYFFIAVAKDEIPAYTITCLRMLPALAIVMPAMWIMGQRLPGRWQDWLWFAPLALTNTLVPFVLTVHAQREVTGGMAAVICATTPLFALFMAHIITNDEKITRNKLAGLAVGIAGVCVLALPDLLAGAQGPITAKLLLLTVALLYATGGLYARRLRGTPAMVITNVQMILTFFMALPLMLLIDRPWTQPAPSLAAAASVAGTGIIASGIASICYFTLIRRAGATNALLVTLLLPLTPIFLGWAFLGERMSAREWMGAAIVAAALLIIDGRLVSRHRRS